MAMIKTTRKGWFGIRRYKIAGPSSEGTKAAFAIGDALTHEAGPKPKLQRILAMHLENTAS